MTGNTGTGIVKLLLKLTRICLKCGLSTKIWAMIMAFGNLGLGIFLIIGGSIWMANKGVSDNYGTGLYFLCGVIVGVISIAAGCILITALVQGKETTVLLYILVESIIVVTLTVFSAMNVFENGTAIIFALFCLCPLMWIGIFNVYGFYLELHKYNNETVQAGVEEIACNTHTNPLAPFPEKAVDTTSV